MSFGIITDFNDLWLTLIATVLYFTLYYAFMFNIALRRKVKIIKGIRREEIAKDHIIIAANRSFLNMLEQMPPFIISMWLFSIFCHPYWGGSLGILYTIIRAGYYFLYPPPKAYLVTFPNYFIIWTYMICLLVQAFIMAY